MYGSIAIPRCEPCCWNTYKNLLFPHFIWPSHVGKNIIHRAYGIDIHQDEHGWTCLENRGWKKPSYFAGSTASHKTTTSKVSNNINHRSFLWMGKQVFKFYLGVSHYIFGSLYWYMGVPVCEPTLQKRCRICFQGGSLRNWLVIVLTLPTHGYVGYKPASKWGK